MKRFLTALIAMLFFVSCEEFTPEKDDNIGNGDNNYENPEDTPQKLPRYCDFKDFNGWSNARLCDNGMAILTKNFEDSQTVHKSLILQYSSQYGFWALFSEYDQNGFPTYISLNDTQIYIEEFDGTTLDAIYMANGENCLLEGLPFEYDNNTRAWNENNWVRNTCAVGGIVTSSLGIASGVAISLSGWGAIAGVPTIIFAVTSLHDNMEILLGSGDDYAAENDYIADQMQGILFNTLSDSATFDSDSFLSLICPEYFNQKYNTPNTFWAELTFGLIDNFWGETKTDSQQAKEALLNSQEYVIETGEAVNITEKEATVIGYVSPDALSPLGNKNANVRYGAIVYNMMDTSKRQFTTYTDKTGGAFNAYFENLSTGTTYGYFTYYSDLTNAIVRFAEQKKFTTKGEFCKEDYMSKEEQEAILKEYLIKFYRDTDGDNWFNNKNWCSDKPLEEWYGVTCYVAGYDAPHWYLHLSKNNLNGKGDLSGCNIIQTVELFNNEGLTGLDLSNCKRLESVYYEGNYLTTSIDVSNCTRLEYFSCFDNSSLTSINTQGCQMLKEYHCSSNQSLTSLDVSNSGSLLGLNCIDNAKLTNLNVSNCPNLLGLTCMYNDLTYLNVNGCTSVTTIRCDYNRLKVLNLSECKQLDYLDCTNNELTDINAEGCTKLWDVSCQNNRITREVTGVFANLALFDYDARYTNYWCDDNNVWHYTDNGVGWWWPGEPHKGPHIKHQ